MIGWKWRDLVCRYSKHSVLYPQRSKNTVWININLTSSWNIVFVAKQKFCNGISLLAHISIRYLASVLLIQVAHFNQVSVFLCAFSSSTKGKYSLFARLGVAMLSPHTATLNLVQSFRFHLTVQSIPRCWWVDRHSDKHGHRVTPPPNKTPPSRHTAYIHFN